jgi:NAD(P)-dependent dehydrogenase (short-subunit alcohol dehydrogenase family)
MSLTQSMLEQFNKFPILLQPGDCAGKVCVVTGSNIGIGLETAKHLVCCSAARVTLAVRNIKGGEEAKKVIEAATNRTGVIDVWHLDLASFASVKAFAQKASSELVKLDILVENAAVYKTSTSGVCPRALRRR